MTCKRTKIISGPDSGSYSVAYNYGVIPLFIVYLCIPIVSLMKYIYTDIMKAYVTPPKDEIKDGSSHDTDEFVRLKVENALLKEEVQRRKYTRDMLSVLKNYEHTLKRFMEEHKNVLAERDALRDMLSSLEENYHIMTLKYETARDVIDGLEKNEETLRQHLQKWENAMQSIEKKYECFKEYAVGKIDSANSQIKSTDTEYKHEICKLKTKVIESQLRITELETQICNMPRKGSKCKMPNYLFEPLVTNIN